MKTIIRLGQYLEILGKVSESKKYISSKELGELNYVTPSTVRQDFFYFDTLKGKTKRGYEIESLKKEIVKILGLEKGRKLIIIGAGKIGTALSQYKDFKKLNIEFTAFFDIKESLIGKEIEGIRVYHLNDLKDYLKFHPEVEIATLCVPPDSAQDVADKAIKAGIKALWNFSPIIIKVPDNILIEYEFVGTSLYSLIYAMKKRNIDK
jgi:redox-sensing transcriptional repressor